MIHPAHIRTKNQKFPSRNESGINVFRRVMAIIFLLVFAGILDLSRIAYAEGESAPPCSLSPVNVPISLRPYGCDPDETTGCELMVTVDGPDLPSSGMYVAWMNWAGVWYATFPKYLEAGYKYVANACTSDSCYYKVFWHESGEYVGGDVVKTVYVNHNTWTQIGHTADVTMTVCREGGEDLEIDLSLADGQRFTQGDDVSVEALVTRGNSTTVKGANVRLKLVSPRGTEFVQQAVTTDSNGLAAWRSYFTADATVGNWRVVAEATFDAEEASISRTVELVKVNVTPSQVQDNITKIAQDWLSNGQPDGITESFISGLWWPKGMKVNLREHMDSRYSPYTCSSQAFKTLKFLNNIRFSPQKDRRLLMAGVDYGPISDGTSLIHVAVGIYPNGSDWLSGYVLEPWFNQKKEVWNSTAWSVTFGADPLLDWRIGNPWTGEYPTTGSDGGYYPALSDSSVPTMLQGANRTRMLTYSPVYVIVRDSQGRRVGRLSDSSVVNEIDGAEQSNTNNEDGTFVSMISVPNGQYQVTITGNGDGEFHLVTGTDTDIVNYGEQAIQDGERATFRLKSTDLDQPLTLPDGSEVTPDAGLPEGDLGGSGGDSGGGCFVNALLSGR